LFIVYSHIILPPGLRGALPDIANTWMDFGAVATDQTEDKDNRKKKEILQKGALEELKKDRVCQFNQFIDSIRPAKEPTLYFQHILLPHSPYDYLPSGKKYAMDSGLRGLNSGRWGDDVTAVNQSYQRYLLQVGFVDTLIGKLITHLKTVGLYDPSLIVITADHGVSLRPNDFRRALKKTNYGDIMQIPFFIKLPNQNGGVTSDRNVETIDLLPTIADILGIRLPWPHDGRSALDLSMPERTEKIMHNDAYERFVFDSTLDAKYITLKRKLSLFGSGSKPYGLFKMGHHSEFIGRRVAEIGVAGQCDLDIQFDMPIFLANLDMDSDFVPAQIKGDVFLKDETIGELDLALAVNGMICAVTQTFWQERNKAKFSVIVPETVFQKGRNEVDVFVISESNGQTNLMSTKSQSKTVTYSLVTSSGLGEIIISSNGASMPVISDALKGYLDVADVKGDRVVFAGWAADVKNSQLPEAIAIFVNGEFFYSMQLNLDRPDVVKAFDNAELERAGFEYIFPLSLFKNIFDSEVRFFAVANDVASELNYEKGYMWRKKQSSNTCSLSMSSKEGYEIITSSNGASMPVIPDALKGYLDIAVVKGDRVVFAGWAADVKNSQLSEAIVIFVNGEFFYLGQCNIDRPDVVKVFNNASLERAGFEYIFPLSLFKNIGDSEVRIFALSKKGVGTELIYPKGYTMGQNS
jgi:hypothetical protein